MIKGFFKYWEEVFKEYENGKIAITDDGEGFIINDEIRCENGNILIAFKDGRQVITGNVTWLGRIPTECKDKLIPNASMTNYRWGLKDE